MVFAAERCRNLADCYEKIAKHEAAPMAHRMLFARKANLFRVIARLAVLDEERKAQWLVMHSSQT
jgi:hypothetical protein